jgi:N-methylhydantoinase A/oxoprolinase/acetone carboxylase beta subunit
VARRDIKGEGFSPDEAAYYLELIGDGDLADYIVRSDKVQLASMADVKGLCAQFGRPDKKGPAKVTVSTLILNAFVPMPHYELSPSPLAGEDPSAALREERDVFWSPEAGYKKTPIYNRELLMPGNRVIGPSVVEAKDTTYVIPANRSFYISEYSQGVLREV